MFVQHARRPFASLHTYVVLVLLRTYLVLTKNKEKDGREEEKKLEGEIINF